MSTLSQVMLRAELLHPSGLSAQDADVWRGLAAATPAFANPLLGPDFAQAVGQVREDARVAIWREGDAARGFLPVHCRPGGYARPIGAPVSDYHALVSSPDFRACGRHLLELAGLGAFSHTGLIDPWGLFGTPSRTVESHVVALDAPSGDYLEGLRADSPKKFKNWRRLDHRLEREVGPVRLVAPDTSEATFATLMTWKREQLHRTGGHDFLSPDWTSRLFADLFGRREGDFQGLMIGLYAGDRLVAGHFGVRLKDVYHPWIAAADPDLAAVSPGQIFLVRAIGEMSRLGLTTYDLGPGHDHYKRAFARTRIEISAGLVTAPTPAGRTAASIDRAWALAGARRDGFAARLRRRLEVIAAAETSLIGRTRGLADAVAGQARRRLHSGDAD